jgi:Tfp pilus assembly protein PilF
MTEAIARLREDFAKANALALQGQIDQARSAFADVAKQAEQQIDKKDVAPAQQVQLRVIAGESWLAANAPGKAQAQFEILVRQAPANVEMQTALAAAQLLQNDLDAADVSLSRALRANTDYAAAHALKACALLKRSEPIAAAREFRQSGLSDLKAPVAPWVRLVLAELDCRPEKFRQ